MSALPTVARQIYGKKKKKNDQSGIYHCWHDIGSPKTLFISFAIYLDYIMYILMEKFKQNRRVRNLQKLSFLAKNSSPFWQSVNAILEDISVTKTIV